VGAHGFIRTHRAYVINARRAVEIDRNANGTALVELTGGERIPVSRRQLTTVRAALTA
jgi:DNA-binding LytR/AlgR family response regulator